MSHEPAPTVAMVIKATLDGWPIDISLNIAPAALGRALARLGELGYQPRHEVPPPAPRQAPRPKVEAGQSADGAACCPVHKRKLVEGRYGRYCPARAKEGEVADKRGYCGLKFD